MNLAKSIGGTLQARICMRSLGPAFLVSCIVLSGCVVYERPATAVVVRSRPRVVAAAPPPAEPEPQAAAAAEVSPAVQQLEPLVAPVALYPDPLLAVVLPASSYPDAIQTASTWVAANPMPPEASIEAQPWPSEVKALVHYPDALTYLSADPQFTTSLGAAYTSQPADVTLAVQDLRAQASTAGSLQSNEQQEVVVQEAGVIAIQPANPAVIFVPRYDPVTIYAVGFTPIVYGPSFVIGPWLAYGYDWGGGGIFVGDWRGPYFYEGGRWGYRGGWVHPDRWRHDERFGRAPLRPAGGYHTARAIAGRTQAFRAQVARHAERVRQTNARNASVRQSGRTTGQKPVASGQQKFNSTGQQKSVGSGQQKTNSPNQQHSAVPDPSKINKSVATPARTNSPTQQKTNGPTQQRTNGPAQQRPAPAKPAGKPNQQKQK
jgi:hypothetical protein